MRLEVPVGEPADGSAGTNIPIGDGEFAALIGALGPFPVTQKGQRAGGPHIGVAVSGGPDSMALAVLANRWAAERGGSLLAITVDHELRPEAAQEARDVARQLSGRGIAHAIAVWRREGGAEGRKTGQAKAREARYALLAQVCRAQGIATLLMAHHAGDQAETLLQRLDHRSGPTGLACIRPVRLRQGLRVLRPLLGLPKARLEATCRAAGLVPAYDPTNEDLRHERPAIRQLLDLAGRGPERRVGRGPERRAGLCAAAGRAGLASARIDQAAARASLACIRTRPPGFAWLAPDALAALPPLIAERMVAMLVSAIAGGAYQRGEGLERFVAWLAGGAAGRRGRTFGRAYARRARDIGGRSCILICREPSNLPLIAAGTGLYPHWDGRFCVDLRATGFPGATLAPLGDALARDFKTVWNCPADAAKVLPGLWKGGEIVALPQFSLHDRLENAGDLAMYACRWAPRRTMTSSIAGQNEVRGLGMKAAMA